MKRRIFIMAVALLMCVTMLSSCDLGALVEVADEIDLEQAFSGIVSMLFGNGQSSEEDEGVNEKNDELNVNLYKIDPGNGQYLTIDNGLLFNDVLWEPGMAHRLNLVVSNEDVLACQYRIFLLKPDDKDQSMSETAEFIEVYVCNPEIDLDRNMLNSSSEYYVGTLKEVFNRSIDSGYLMPWERGYFTIMLKMREDASNEFSVSMPCFVCVHVDATPVEEENDVFGNAYDDDFSSNEGTYGLEYYPLPDGTYAVSAGTTEYLEEIVIPAEYNGKAVTVISAVAFMGYTNLKKITIPDTVTSIGDRAFYGCLSLESITIPESVINVGEDALISCNTIHYAGTVAQAKEIFASCFSDTQLCLIVSADGKYYANGDDIVDPPIELIGTYDITMWVSEKEGVADQFKEQIAAFMAANPGIVINAQIEGVTEADAGSKVVADVATAPDIYCFAQDQLARLVQAAALAAPGKAAAETIKAQNDAGSVAAASVAGTLYAYPMTSDNGYYLYYDTSIISPEDADSMEAIIAACEENGVKFRYALENAWYTASFFFATGCHSNWIMNTEGQFNAIDDDFNSAAGLAAMKGMQKLAQSSCYDSDADIFTDAGAIVTGIWNAGAAAEHFGANLGATDLPSFTVDGTSYHLGSFSGNRLMGVKPQIDAKRAAVLSLLAQYLTGERCQQQRYESFEWGPSNVAAQQSPEVQANASLAALAKQNAYGHPQGQIHGSWWDIAKVLGADAKAAKSAADLQTALDNYDAAIERWLQIPPEKRYAWGVIGGICGTSWDTDFPMTEGPDGTYTTEPLELHAGEEFKVRQGASWDLNFGVECNGANIVVEADGIYIIQLVWDGGGNGMVSLIPVE